MLFNIKRQQSKYKFIMALNPQQTKKSRAHFKQVQSHSFYSNHLNNSSSKMRYSIPKNPRFKEKKQKTQYKYYDLPSMFSSRSAAFGYGEKMDFSKSPSKAPPPNKYSLPSDFDRRRSNAIAIGLGRELVKAVSVFDDKAYKNPGPGTYNPKELQSQKKILLLGRQPDKSTKWLDQVPGPGTYKTMQLLNKNLKSNVSKFESCKSGKFAKGEERGDFEKTQKKKNIPGPGSYKTIGYEFIEQFVSHKGKSFEKSQRPSIANKSQAPGPGTYKYANGFME